MAGEVTIGCLSRPYGNLGPAEAYERIAAAGFTELGVYPNPYPGELPLRGDDPPEKVASIRNMAAAAGLKPVLLLGHTTLDQGLETAVEDYRKLIDRAAELGVSWLIDAGTAKEELYESYFELMRRAAPHAEEAGIGITMKPHGGISLTADDLLAAARRVDHPAFAICYDPGNIIFYSKGEHRPEPDAEKVAASASTLIIKDCSLETGTREDVNVTAGDGLVDFPVLLRKLVDGGFKGPCFVECVGGHQLPEIDRDLAFTRGYIKGILSAL